MSTFGNNLIERLRTRLVDVQRQKKLTESSIALAKNLNINGNTRKRGERTSRLSCGSSLPVVASSRPRPEILSTAEANSAVLGGLTRLKANCRGCVRYHRRWQIGLVADLLAQIGNQFDFLDR
jgi:hypothetical protein